LACNNGLILAGARGLLCDGTDRLFFAGLGTTNKFHVPSYRAGRTRGLGLAAGSARTVTYSEGSTTPSLGKCLYPTPRIHCFRRLVFGALSVLAVIVLRYRKRNLERPYRTWGYPVIPAIFLILSSLLVLNLGVLGSRNVRGRISYSLNRHSCVFDLAEPLKISVRLNLISSFFLFGASNTSLSAQTRMKSCCS